MIVTGKFSEKKTVLLYNLHCEEYSSNSCENRDRYSHTTLDHKKNLLDKFHGH